MGIKYKRYYISRKTNIINIGYIDIKNQTVIIGDRTMKPEDAHEEYKPVTRDEFIQRDGVTTSLVMREEGNRYYA